MFKTGYYVKFSHAARSDGDTVKTPCFDRIRLDGNRIVAYKSGQGEKALGGAFGEAVINLLWLPVGSSVLYTFMEIKYAHDEQEYERG